MLTAVAFAVLLTPDQGPIGNRKLVWSDEFSGKGLPDQQKWGYEKGFIRNHEKQLYTDKLRNAYKEDGNLVISAINDNGEVSSAALESNQSWLYGYFEIRAKIPTGKGTWPAIWFLGQGIRQKGTEYIGWPKCGEIDLMENVGFNPATIYFTVHTADDGGSGHASKGEHVDTPGASSDFHVYGLDWRPGSMDFYFDGKKVMTYSKSPQNRNSWPFDKPEFLILNLAIGGDWGGQQGIDDSIFPATFLVDYVRVYQ
jgi:beta-glucanase (GH16 family)